MAGNNNAKPAKQAKPATNAAMAETAGNAAEQIAPLAAGPGDAFAGFGDTFLDGFEPMHTIGPEDMGNFSVAVFDAVAGLIAGAGFLVRQDGEEVAPYGDGIRAVRFGQGEGITAVTTDGRKFILQYGEVYDQ
jgi:hypothetical protein